MTVCSVSFLIGLVRFRVPLQVRQRLSGLFVPRIRAGCVFALAVVRNGSDDVILRVSALQ